MADLPFFLKACGNFPLSLVDKENPPVGGRSFELAVGLESLLETNDAAELLLGFLMQQQEGGGDRTAHANNNVIAIWLTDAIFITNASSTIIEATIVKLDIEVVDTRCVDLAICRVLTSKPPVQRAREGSLPPLNAIFRLLAKHKSIQSISAWRPFAYRLPVSLDALKTFVSESQSRRTLRITNAGLSLDQWRVILNHCDPNVVELQRCNSESERTRYRLEPNDWKFVALLGAVKRYRSPSSSDRLYVDKLPDDMFQIMVTVLQSTKSLKVLNVDGKNPTRLLDLCQAISKNHSLEELSLSYTYRPFSFSDSGWEIFCKAIGSHPTLQKVTAYMNFCESSQTPERDQILIQRISNNTVLRKFKDRAFFFRLNRFERVIKAVGPILERNHFQAVLRTIQHETDATRRQKLLTAVFLKAPVGQRPAMRFLLLKTHCDDLLLLSPELLLLSLSSSWPKHHDAPLPPRARLCSGDKGFAEL